MNHVNERMKVNNTKQVFLCILGWLLLTAQLISAWGRMGHYIIGEATWQLLPKDTQHQIKQHGYILNNTMGTASIWADAAKYTQKYAWTRSLHYLDNELSHPPHTCILDPQTQTQSNILTAIANFTTAFQTNESERQFHFLMVLHLLQDIYQPLHLSGTKRGGTQEMILPPGKTKKMSLHEYWDVDLIKKLVKHLGTLEDAIHDVVLGARVPPIEPSICKGSEDLWEEAKETEMVNCDLVWKLPVDEQYQYDGTSVVFDLLVRATRQSVCHITYNLLSASSSR